MKQMLVSIGHAVDGIVDLVKRENNAKIHVISTLLVILVGLRLDFWQLSGYG